MKTPIRLWAGYKLRQAATKTDGIAPDLSYFSTVENKEESSPHSCRPAVYNHEHLERVQSCGFNRQLKDLVQTLDETSYLQAPLQSFHIGPATVIGGLIVTPERHIIHSSHVPVTLRDALAFTELRDRAVLANSMPGLRYFGHWLSDDVSAFEAASEDPDLLSLPLPNWSDATFYKNLFGQTWKEQRVIRTRSLTLLRDLGFSSAKAGRYRELRQKLRDRLGARGRDKVVFLKRGPSGDPREIANLQQFEAALTSAGVSIVTVEGDPSEMVKQLVDAPVIITIEGSQDRHGIYTLRDGGAMITIAPPDRFYIATHEWARCLDMRSGVIIGKPAEGGFDVDPDEVLAMIDYMLPRVHNLDTA